MTDKAPKKLPDSNASIYIIAFMVATGIAQCLHPTHGRSTYDACGGPGSHPVTIGGSMVVACH